MPMAMKLFGQDLQGGAKHMLRLAAHNAGKGAIATSGCRWEYECIFGATGARARALRLEALLQLHINKTAAEVRQIALREIEENGEFRGFELVDE
eukprot:5802741-Pleurochrysis_carterae.AAC.2